MRSRSKASQRPSTRHQSRTSGGDEWRHSTRRSSNSTKYGAFQLSTLSAIPSNHAYSRPTVTGQHYTSRVSSNPRRMISSSSSQSNHTTKDKDRIDMMAVRRSLQIHRSRLGDDAVPSITSKIHDGNEQELSSVIKMSAVASHLSILGSHLIKRTSNTPPIIRQQEDHYSGHKTQSYENRSTQNNDIYEQQHQSMTFEKNQKPIDVDLSKIHHPFPASESEHAHPHPTSTPTHIIPPFTGVERALFLPNIDLIRFTQRSHSSQLLRRIGFNLVALTAHPFFPDRFPHSLIRPRDYTFYSIHQFISNIAGAAASVVSMQAMLLSVGLTAIQATPAAAALTWILKDLLGQIGGSLLAAQISQQRENQPRLQRYRSTIVFIIASLIELSTLLRPSALLLLGTIATLLKNLSWIWSASSKARTHLTFVNTNHITDITAKSAAQSTAAGVIGTSLGAFTSYALSTSTSSSSASTTATATSSSENTPTHTPTSTSPPPSSLTDSSPTISDHKAKDDLMATDDLVVKNDGMMDHRHINDSTISQSSSIKPIDGDTSIHDTVLDALTTTTTQISTSSQFQLQVALFLGLSMISLYFTIKSLRYVHINTFDLQRAVLFTNTACSHINRVFDRMMHMKSKLNKHHKQQQQEQQMDVVHTTSDSDRQSPASDGDIHHIITPLCSPEAITPQEDYLFHYRQPYGNRVRIDFGLLLDDHRFLKAFPNGSHDLDRIYSQEDYNGDENDTTTQQQQPSPQRKISPYIQRFIEAYSTQNMTPALEASRDLPYYIKIDPIFHHRQPHIASLIGYSQHALQQFTHGTHTLWESITRVHAPSSTAPGESHSINDQQHQTQQHQAQQLSAPTTTPTDDDMSDMRGPKSIRLIWKPTTTPDDQILGIAHGLLCKHILLHRYSHLMSLSIAPIVPSWNSPVDTPGTPLEHAIFRFVQQHIMHVPPSVSLSSSSSSAAAQPKQTDVFNQQDNYDMTAIIQSKYLLYEHGLDLTPTSSSSPSSQKTTLKDVILANITGNQWDTAEPIDRSPSFALVSM